MCPLDDSGRVLWITARKMPGAQLDPQGPAYIERESFRKRSKD